MELRQLEHFVAVAEERNFTRAAERLHIVQSGLSASIRGLERELNAPLFIRNTRRVGLTQAGRVFLEEARRTLAAAASALDAVAAVQGLLRGTVTIASSQALSLSALMPDLLSRFHAAYPNVVVHLSNHDLAPTVLERLKEGQYDLVFTLLAGPPPGGVTVTRLADDTLVFACAPDHPLAGRQQVALADLRDETFVNFRTAGGGMATVVDEVFAASGIVRRIGAETEDFCAVLELVAHGFGVALVPSRVTWHVPRIRYLPLSPPAGPFQVAVAIAADNAPSPAARALLAMVVASGLD